MQAATYFAAPYTVPRTSCPRQSEALGRGLGDSNRQYGTVVDAGHVWPDARKRLGWWTPGAPQGRSEWTLCIGLWPGVRGGEPRTGSSAPRAHEASRWAARRGKALPAGFTVGSARMLARVGRVGWVRRFTPAERMRRFERLRPHSGEQWCNCAPSGSFRINATPIRNGPGRMCKGCPRLTRSAHEHMRLIAPVVAARVLLLTFAAAGAVATNGVVWGGGRR